MTDNQQTHNYSSQQDGVFLIINKQMVPLVKAVTTLGRQLGNDILLHEEFVSRFHAEIISKNGQHLLVDKNSTSGTFVNGKRLTGVSSIREI